MIGLILKPLGDALTRALEHGPVTVHVRVSPRAKSTLSAVPTAVRLGSPLARGAGYVLRDCTMDGDGCGVSLTAEATKKRGWSARKSA